MKPRVNKPRLRAVAIIEDQNVTHNFQNMKHFCVFFLLAAVSMAADFTTAQAARAVVGQATFTAALAGASHTLIGAAPGLAYTTDALFVADRHRDSSTPLTNGALTHPLT